MIAKQTFFKRLGVTVAVACSGCCPATRQRSETANVHHVVTCWLKRPGDPAARARLIRASMRFTEIPGVKRVNAGTVLPSARPTVDSTFDVAVVITFEDRKALSRYLKHPRHRQAVELHLKPLTRKVVVYDFMEGPRP